MQDSSDLLNKIHTTINILGNCLLATMDVNLLIKCQSCHHVETIQLIFIANYLTGFYMMKKLELNKLIQISLIQQEFPQSKQSMKIMHKILWPQRYPLHS